MEIWKKTPNKPYPKKIAVVHQLLLDNNTTPYSAVVALDSINSNDEYSIIIDKTEALQILKSINRLTKDQQYQPPLPLR